MVQTIKGLVVAIPAALTATGCSIARLIAAEQGDLVLGATTADQLRTLETSIPPGEIAYAVQVDLERPKSVDEFFHIAIGQFGHLDAIVLETAKSAARSPPEKAIGASVRRLLHCLDAALRYCEGDFHIVSISPLADRYAFPVATTFLGGKLAASKWAASSAPSLRMSIVSPADDANADDGTLARTVLHVLSEPRNPDVSEAMLWRRSPSSDRRPNPEGVRSKSTVAT
jgi:NADP-dependent 3-hydroxy acid dehydrogenase YdfG